MKTDPTKLKVAKELGRQDIWFSLAREPKTARVIVGSSDFKLYEVDLSAEKPEPVARGEHTSYVTCVARAGEFIVSGSYDCQLRWWQAGKSESVRSVDAHAKRIRMLATSPDGALVASVGDDMVCRLWDARAGKKVHELKGHDAMTPHHFPSMLYAVAFTPDGKHVATGDRAGKVVLWDVNSGKQVQTFDASGTYTWDPSARRHSIGGIRSLAFSPDGKTLAVGGMSKVGNIDHPDAPGRLEVFDVASAKQTMVLQTDGKLKGMIEGLAFHPSGEWLVGAGGGYAGFIAFFDLKANKILFQDAAPMHVHGLSLAENGETIYAVGHNKAVVWSLSDKKTG